MNRMENPIMKTCSSNLHKVFQNILTVVLLDVKNQFTYGDIDPTVVNFQNILESSITTKLQEEEFISLHLKDFENSIVECSLLNEESVFYEKSVLENKLRETQDKYDYDIKTKIKVIDGLKKELKEKEDVLQESIKSYDQFKKGNKELSIAKENAEKLEQENKQLKHKLKCMECKFDALRKSCIGDREKKSKKNEEASNIEVEVVSNDKAIVMTKEKTNVAELQVQDKDGSNEKDVDIMEGTLNLSTLNTQVELLTEQIDQLKSKKIQVEDDIDMKEGKIISLQSTIDKMKIIILQCKTKEHNLSLQLEYANLNIDKLQRTISNLKKEKDEIHKDAQRNNLKSTYMENQWDRIVTMSNKKNDKIQTLQNEKNSLLHKLKENNKLLAEKDDECAKMIIDFDQTKQKYSKVCQSMDKLKNSYSDMEKSCNSLQYEKVNLESKLKEKESANESQLSRFLKQLNVSGEEVRDDSKKSVEGMDIGEIAQRIINKQRKELSSIKTNMHWMKEALEVSGKDRLDLQSLLSLREEELTQVHAKLIMFEETNKHLSNSLVTQQADTTSLQKVLQNAVVSYDGVCSLFEKHEKELRRERDSYNSEIMVLQNKLRRKSSIKAESDFHPFQSGIQFSEDLRFILGNIKDQLSSTLNNMSSRLERGIPNLSNATSNGIHTFNASTYDDSGTDLTEDTTLTNSSQTCTHEDVLSNSTVGSNTQKLNEYLEMHNSVIHHSEVAHSTFHDKNADKMLIDHSKSLLGSTYPMFTSTEKEDTKQFSDSSLSVKVDENSSCASVNLSSEGCAVSNSENNAVLKLQEKLSQLQQMGTNLKTNNTELTEMMKTHSKKLKMLKNKASENK